MNKKLLYLYHLFSFLSLIFGAIIIGLALIPSYLLMAWLWKLTGDLASVGFQSVIRSFGFGLSYFVFISVLLITLVIFRNILGIKNKEVKGQYISLGAIKTASYNWMISISKHLALPLFRNTPFNVWFYRGMGAQIGRNTFISTTRLWDCDLLEIGDHCVIGGNVAISCHITSSMGRGILKKVKIGNRVTIGADSMIFPGVTIGDNVVIVAGSIVPQDSELESHSIYSGVPVEKIR